MSATDSTTSTVTAGDDITSSTLCNSRFVLQWETRRKQTDRDDFEYDDEYNKEDDDDKNYDTDDDITTSVMILVQY